MATIEISEENYQDILNQLDTINARVTVLENENTALKRDLNQFKELEARNSTALKTDLYKVRNDFDKFTKGFTDFIPRLATGLGKQIMDYMTPISKANSNLSNEVNKLKITIKGLEDQTSKFEQSLDATEITSKLENTFQTLSKNIGEAFEAMHQEISQFQNNVTSEVQGMNHIITTVQEAIQSVKSQDNSAIVEQSLATYNNKVMKAVSQVIDVTNQELAKLQDTYTILLQQYNEISKNKSSTSFDNQKFIQAIEKTQKDIKILQEQYENLAKQPSSEQNTDKLSSILSHIAELNQNFETLEKNMIQLSSKQNTTVEVVKEAIGEKNQELAKLQNAYNLLHQKYNEISENKSSPSFDSQKFIQAIEKAQKDIEILQAQYENSAKQPSSEQNTAKMSSIENQIAQLNQGFERLSTNLQNHQASSAQVLKELETAKTNIQLLGQGTQTSQDVAATALKELEIAKTNIQLLGQGVQTAQEASTNALNIAQSLKDNIEQSDQKAQTAQEASNNSMKVAEAVKANIQQLDQKAQIAQEAIKSQISTQEKNLTDKISTVSKNVTATNESLKNQIITFQQSVASHVAKEVNSQEAQNFSKLQSYFQTLLQQQLAAADKARQADTETYVKKITPAIVKSETEKQFGPAIEELVATEVHKKMPLTSGLENLFQNESIQHSMKVAGDASNPDSDNPIITPY